MGDPRKHRKKYSTPSHPWQKERIVEEVELMKAYGLKNKSEIWRANSYLKKILAQAKKFATVLNEQEELEKQQFVKKLQSFGFIEGDDLGKALDLKINDILERRLQTIVHRKGLARSMNQARQFITHRHIEIGGKKITIPSYKVELEQEPKVTFVGTSALSKDDHPERVILKKEEKKPKKERRAQKSGPARKAPVKRASLKRAPARKAPAKKAE